MFEFQVLYLNNAVENSFEFCLCSSLIDGSFVCL